MVQIVHTQFVCLSNINKSWECNNKYQLSWVNKHGGSFDVSHYRQLVGSGEMADICTISPFPRRASMKKWQMFVECTSRGNGPLKNVATMRSLFVKLACTVCCCMLCQKSIFRLCNFYSHLSPAHVNSVVLLSLIVQWRFMNYWLECCGRKPWFCYEDTEESHEEASRQPDEIGKGTSRVRYMLEGYTARFYVFNIHSDVILSSSTKLIRLPWRWRQKFHPKHCVSHPGRQ